VLASSILLALACGHRQYRESHVLIVVILLSFSYDSRKLLSTSQSTYICFAAFSVNRSADRLLTFSSALLRPMELLHVATNKHPKATNPCSKILLRLKVSPLLQSLYWKEVVTHKPTWIVKLWPARTRKNSVRQALFTTPTRAGASHTIHIF
jgi:hypothetical protein